MNRKKINIDKARSADGIALRKEAGPHAVLKQSRIWNAVVFLLLVGYFWICFQGRPAWGQEDQGAITGVVLDTSGAVIRAAQVNLTNTDTGLAQQTKSDGSGVYVFPSVKIGHYKVSATAPGFQTTVQQNLQLNIQERLNVKLTLNPGATTQTITVTTAPPLLQTQSGSVGQVMDSKTINDTPLANRNWVYMAQLSAGVVPSNGTRGGGTGDYEANGQRAEQNAYILDGVDNSVNIVDYENGSMYAVAPIPDAVSEFKLETADFSAEFGHSAGSVLNVSIKSGTNQFHGDVFEYFRNTALDAKNWTTTINPAYRQNQFGATLGGPILKNKLFYFGDIQDTRLFSAAAASNVYSVPTADERVGDFSELLIGSNNSNGHAQQLYQPNSGGGAANKLSCSTNTNGHNGNNVFCTNQLNAVALGILALYPQPNAGGPHQTYNNLVENLPTRYDPVQWDQRLDWNISAKDQAFARYSYVHVIQKNTAPLGPILDGTGNFIGQSDTYITENVMVSETHVFNPSLENQFSFSYNWGKFQNLQENSTVNVAANLGMGGMPFGPDFPNNGGLPQVSVGSITGFGTHGNDPSIEGQNIYQILDNVTKIHGNNTFKTGVDYENVRVLFLQPPAPRGNYGFNGQYTSSIGVANTGNGIADFLADQMNSASITNEPVLNDQFSYVSGYVEDNWKTTPKLTLELGLRYDYFQPYREMAGQQANFIPGAEGIGTGTGTYDIPAQSSKVTLSPVFINLLAKDNITLHYNPNSRLSTGQKTNFAPRLSFAYQLDNRTVLRGGYGIFYGAIQSTGSNGNIGENYPFVVHANLVTPNCSAGHPCNSLQQAYEATPGDPSTGPDLENGLSTQLAAGIINFISSPGLFGRDVSIKTPATTNYNLSLQHAFSNNLSATLGYVGNISRNLMTLISPDPAMALMKPGQNTNQVSPYPDFSSANLLTYAASSNYNSLQATLEKRYSNGVSFLATYTWAKAMDDSTDPLGGGTGYRATGLIPITDEYTLSNYDVRHRFTFNGEYELPFGKGRARMNQSRVADLIAGGWRGSLTFVAQTGLPFTVGTANISTAAGGGARAIQIGDPFKAGGTPNATNPSITCPAKVHTKAHWYNPCAFANPLPGNLIGTPGYTSGTSNGQPYDSSPAHALQFLGGKSNTIHGPGFNRINISLFKEFATVGQQYLQVRADAFNLFNHPSWGQPGNTNDSTNAGLITSYVSLQNNTPDARFFQLSAKYIF